MCSYSVDRGRVSSPVAQGLIDNKDATCLRNQDFDDKRS
jgi:hypothetical protein